MSFKVTVCVAACLVYTSAHPASAEVIRTGPVDSIRFQAIVDAASPRDMIVCGGGTYDFSAGPVRIDKPLTIVAQDESDPPVFMGRTDSAGRPMVGTSVETGNNAFVVWGLEADVHGLEFAGLHFRGFQRALAFMPSFVPSEDCRPTHGSLSKLRVIRSNFLNNSRAIVLVGGAKHFAFDENYFDITGRVGITVAGSGVFVCAPSGQFIDVGRPSDGSVSRNVLVSTSNFGIGLYIFNVLKTSLRHNTIHGGFQAIEFSDIRGNTLGDDGPIDLGSVEGNHITFPASSGLKFGIVSAGPTSLKQADISRNVVTGATYGIYLYDGANGYRVTDNEFPGGSLETDIVLDEAYPAFGEIATHDNRVVVSESTTVLDLGVNNQVSVKSRGKK